MLGIKNISSVTYSKHFLLIMIVFGTLAGCSGISGVETTQQSPTATSSTASPMPNKTPTATQTSTPTETPIPPHIRKQRIFTSNYSFILNENNVNVTNSAVYGGTETLFLAYQMRDPESDKITGKEERNISLKYAIVANAYIKSGYDSSWIPKQVNVTALTPNGQVYEKGNLKYKWVRKLRSDEIDAFRFLAKYYNTIECGPRYLNCK